MPATHTTPVALVDLSSLPALLQPILVHKNLTVIASGTAFNEYTFWIETEQETLTIGLTDETKLNMGWRACATSDSARGGCAFGSGNDRLAALVAAVHNWHR